jgi:uncharacterized membrane protein
MAGIRRLHQALDLTITARLPTAGALAIGVTAVAAGEVETYFFVCDDQTSYTVRTTDDEAWVFRPEGTLRLPVAPSEHGTAYTDRDFELRIAGQEAKFGKTGGELRSCRNDPRRAVWEQAKLDGADFRAIGHEPAWELRILEQSRIVLVADYGASHVEGPLPEPEVEPEAGITRWHADDLVVEVMRQTCTDTMTGEQFSSQVMVHWRERTLRGCGRPLH